MNGTRTPHASDTGILGCFLTVNRKIRLKYKQIYRYNGIYSLSI